MTSHVLIAIDASPAASGLLDLACRYCQPDRHHLHVLLAIDSSFAVHDHLAPIRQDEEQEYPAACEEQRLGDAAMLKAVAALRERGYTCEGRLVAADPVDAIVSQAEALDCELIVIGHRHMSRLGRLLDPSISAKVIDRVQCAVLVGAAEA
jgi:nucleotide-binding universal stress UspA family protein